MESFDPALRRIYAKIEQHPDGCWIWLGAKNNKGYGHMWHNGVYWLVHRLMYTAHYGPISHLSVIRHICSDGSCVNPSHLVTGTPQDNVHDQIKAGTLRPPKGKCRPYNEYY